MIECDPNPSTPSRVREVIFLLQTLLQRHQFLDVPPVRLGQSRCSAPTVRSPSHRPIERGPHQQAACEEHSVVSTFLGVLPRLLKAIDQRATIQVFQTHGIRGRGTAS